MRSLLNLVFNIIWLLSGGIVLALGYFLFGIIACIFIVTIPAGVASFRMGQFALWPFGRTIVEKPGPRPAGREPDECRRIRLGGAWAGERRYARSGSRRGSR